MNFKCTEKGSFQTTNNNVFKHVCVKGNTINKRNGTGVWDNLNQKAQCLVKYSQESKVLKQAREGSSKVDVPADSNTSRLNRTDKKNKQKQSQFNYSAEYNIYNSI